MSNTQIKFLALVMVGLGIVGGCGEVSTTVTGTSNRKLTMVAPADQSVRQGDANKVALVIVRQNFEDAVEIEIADLPSGVTVAGGNKLTIPSGMLKVDTMTLVADKDASVVTDHLVSVTASGPDGISATEFFKVTVKART